MTRTWKFDCGSAAEAASGYTKVRAEDRYDKEKGYGFLEGGIVTAVDRGEQGTPRRDGLIPFGAAFRVDVAGADAGPVEEAELGYYAVHLLIGDAHYDTDTTAKGAAGQLFVSGLRTQAGHFERVSFTLPAADGAVMLHFSGLAPRVNALEVVPAPQPCTVFLAGDSTVADQPADIYPFAGWGQALPALLRADAVCENHAFSGRSSRSFVDEGRLARIWERIKPHDYLLVQFGHNDQKRDEARYTEPSTTYKEYLRLYIEGARSRQAYPVLVTSMHRRFFDGEGKVVDTHGDYLDAVRELAAAEGVPLVDLAEMSRALYEELGPEGSKSLFMWGAPGEFMRHPGGIEDNTHLNERGALQLARLVAQGLKELSLQPLRMYLR